LIVDEQELAEKIGEAGRQFSIHHWSWVDMQAYVSGSSHGVYFAER
jgi:hypothetical protein